MRHYAANKTEINPALLPPGLLLEGEQVTLAIKPSFWLVWLLSWRWLLAALALSGFLALFGPRLGRYAPWIIASLWIIASFRVMLALLDWSGRTYLLTDRRMMRLRGILTLDIFQCELDRIQHTQLIMTLGQRFFHLGTLAFTTAGTGYIEAFWDCINYPLIINQTVALAIEQARQPVKTGKTGQAAPDSPLPSSSSE